MSTIERFVERLGTDLDRTWRGGSADPEVVHILDAVKPIRSDTTVIDRLSRLNAQKVSDTSRTPRTSRKVDLDLAKMKKSGFAVAGCKNKGLLDELRLIKRQLLSHRFEAVDGDHGNLIMVTSAVPGEGKTYTSINLALSLAAEMDRTVLLVDTDVAKRDVTRVLGVQAVKGLTDVLTGDEVNIPDVLMRTNIETLSLLPVGQQHPNTAELVASGKMEGLISELSQRYKDRIVIFDSAPLLAASEAHVLASLVGQVVMVVEAGKTPQAKVWEALELLEQSNAQVSLILNKTSPGGTDYYGHYQA